MLRRLQEGERLALPHSRPMPLVGPRCHELRVPDEAASWRIFYRSGPDAVVVLGIFEKRTKKTPHHVIRLCSQRLRRYEEEG